MKQTFELIDYFGALAASFGSNFDIRCGVHRMRHRSEKDMKATNEKKLMDESDDLEDDTTA
uniref:Uncharacterized protein n=1 Tax=Elaeophora elaphi TaxID=1147741 RepID=A0A0R3RXC3_9BILA